MKKNIIIVCFIFMILIIAFCKRISSAGNLCIKENLLTIFPLLIEYGAILDKKSLELAEITTERTGSLEMKKLVLAQWKKQNKNKHKS